MNSLLATLVAPFAFVARAARLAFTAFREERLPLDPRRWFVDLRHLHGVMSARTSPPPPSGPDAPAAVVGTRDLVTRSAEAELRAFLAGGMRFAFPAPVQPTVSIVLVLCNRAELTFRSLRSIAACTVPVEIVIVDNGSHDETVALLDAVENAIIIRHETNEGFARGVNAGAARASGKYILLLNNDAELLPGSLETAVATAESAPDIGAVGGKLILPDGRLQEAGSIIWKDGSCQGYGRGDDPEAPAYMFRRDVDFASGALLLTPRAQFERLRGLDTDFSPAYYEDVDYCVRLWRSGRRVVYEPRMIAMHFEFSSSGSAERAIALQQKHKARFLEKHGGWLQSTAVPQTEGALAARSHDGSRRRLLFIEDRVPHPRLGSGYPRSNAMLRAALELGYDVTLYPLVVPNEAWPDAYVDVPPETELVLGRGAPGLAGFLRDRSTFYDAIIVSRPHNMRVVRDAWPSWPEGGKPLLVYDAEALFALRAIGRRELHGAPMSASAAADLVADEISLASGCDVILTVSNLERARFLERGCSRVLTLGHAVAPAPTVRPCAQRLGLLFVGAVSDDTAPNADSICWLVSELLPRLQSTLADAVPLWFVGRNESQRVANLAARGFERVGMVTDVQPFFDRARIFVAPTRFGAGIPLKIQQAAAYGLPIVCSSLLAEQLDWRDGIDLLVADTADEFADRCRLLYTDERLWARLREAALERVRTECARPAFERTLEEALRAPAGTDVEDRLSSPAISALGKRRPGAVSGRRATPRPDRS